MRSAKAGRYFLGMPKGSYSKASLGMYIY